MQKYVINTAHVSSEIFGEEAVIVNFMTGKYFGMRGSAPEIWKLFERPVSQDEVMTVIAGTKSISDDTKELVETFINTLLREDLIASVTDPGSGSSGLEPPLPDATAFEEPPIIEVFDDLQELIVLDPIHDADPERGWPAQQRMIKP